jgi:hypothetical protein
VGAAALGGAVPESHDSLLPKSPLEERNVVQEAEPSSCLALTTLSFLAPPYSFVGGVGPGLRDLGPEPDSPSAQPCLGKVTLPPTRDWTAPTQGLPLGIGYGNKAQLQGVEGCVPAGLLPSIVSPPYRCWG